jgi:hypothetical protein
MKRIPIRPFRKPRLLCAMVGIVIGIGKPAIAASGTSIVSRPGRGVAMTAWQVTAEPQRPGARIIYSVPKGNCLVGVDIFVLTGRVVRQYRIAQSEPGSHSIDWMAEGDPPGAYIVRSSLVGDNGMEIPMKSAKCILRNAE